MLRRKMYIVIEMERMFAFTLIALLLSACLLNPRPVIAETRTLSGYPVRNLNTGINYSTIQEAIDSNTTLDGHTIWIGAGKYYEHVLIRKSLWLVGENANATIIDGGGSGPVLLVSANSVTVENLTVQNSGVGEGYAAGISLYDVQNCIIKQNILRDNMIAILLNKTGSSQVFANSVSDSPIGIALSYSHLNKVTANILTNNTYAIETGNSDNNTISQNLLRNGTPWFNNDSTGIGLGTCDHNDILSNNVTNYDHGIRLYNSTQNNITSNLMKNITKVGTYFEKSQYNTVVNNNMTSCGQNGVILSMSSNSNSLVGNKIANNKRGILLDFSKNNVLRGNCMYDNTQYNFHVFTNIQGMTPSDYIQDVDTSNTVDGKPIIYWANQAGGHVPSDAGYVALINCRNIVIRNLTLTKNGSGILCVNVSDSTIEDTVIGNIWEVGINFQIWSRNNTIRRNRITDTAVWGFGGGIGVEGEYNNLEDNVVLNSVSGIGAKGFGNVISGNYISNVTGNGIFLASESSRIICNSVIDSGTGISLEGNNNILTGNNIVGNHVGIATSLTNSLIYHNNFLNNTDYVLAMGGTYALWDNGYPSGGNYWSSYSGSDHNNDGIGDVPYVIDANNKDNYPLTYVQGTLSLLNPASSEAFQITLEPVTGDWRAPNTEYRVTIRKVVNFGIDILGLFAPEAGGIAAATWTVITVDANGDGKVDESEYNDALKSLATSVAEEITKISYIQNLELYSVASQIGLETLAYGAMLAVSGGRVIAAIANSHFAGAFMAPVLICGGVWPFMPNLDLCRINVLYAGYESVAYYSPVELELVTNDGLVLNSTVSQIPEAKYIVRDLDADGDLDGQIILPNLIGSYTLRIVPKVGVSPMDNYTLTIGGGYYQLTLINDGKVQNISSSGYSLSVQIIPETPSIIILLPIMITTLLLVIARRRKTRKAEIA